MKQAYWTCSGFADWIRGTAKPSADTAAGWAAWRRAAKAAHPWRYWLAEKGLDWVEEIVFWPANKWSNLRSYLLNRFVTRTHLLQADPKHVRYGGWCDFGDRLLPCIFDEFVRFVENEHGLDRLEISEDDNEYWEAVRRETAVLYWWWKTDRPNRAPADEKSLAFFVFLEEKYPDLDFLERQEALTPAEATKRRELWAEENEIEKRYFDEDTAMLKRLIDIRESLWS